MITVYAKIKPKNGKYFIEDFEVESLERAEKEIKSIVENFNNTLREGERLREFIYLIKDSKIKKNKKLDFELDNLVLSRRDFKGYRAIKLKETGEVLWFVKSISNKNQLKDITETEFKKIKFKCYEGTPNSLYTNTDYIYVRNKCKKCEMLGRLSGDSIHFCRLIHKTDKLYVYKN